MLQMYSSVQEPIPDELIDILHKSSEWDSSEITQLQLFVIGVHNSRFK